MADEVKELQFESDAEYELWLATVNKVIDLGKEVWVAVQAADQLVSSLRRRAAPPLSESEAALDDAFGGRPRNLSIIDAEELRDLRRRVQTLEQREAQGAAVGAELKKAFGV